MILVVGDIMTDVFVLSELETDGQQEGVLIRGGGSAANTAAWLSASGMNATLIGCVGRDGRGRLLEEELIEQGVRVILRTVAEMETGVVVVEVGEDGDRVMRSARGANIALTPSDITASDRPDLLWIHLSGYSLLGPHGLDLLTTLAALSRDRSIPLSFDPSSMSVVKRFGSVLLDVLSEAYSPVLLPNLSEAIALSAQNEAASAVMALSLRGRVLVKDSARGAISWRDGRPVMVPTTSVKPVNATGAGDAFNAGVIGSLLTGEGVERACTNGNRLAGLVVRQHGARPLPADAVNRRA